MGVGKTPSQVIMIIRLTYNHKDGHVKVESKSTLLLVF